jgi:hypothetical protein
MPNQSKSYPVKSNAARAAVQYGLARTDVFQVDTGAWAFNIPDGVIPLPQKKKAKAAPTESTGTTEGGATVETSKPARRSRSEAAANLRKSKAERKAKEKTAKTARKAKGKGKAKPKAKTKASGPKRKAGPRTGKTAEFISECKRGWVNEADARKRYEWTSNTLRGVLGGYKLKTADSDAPMTFIRKRDEGVTFYRVLSVDAAEKLAA